MKKNMGVTDKITRVSAASLTAILYFTNITNGTIAIILGAIALLFVLTGFIRFCPLYFPFGFLTRNKI
ncbi:glucose uptake protein GlcU [Flavobacterium sp. PL11]|jgi:glucose uptake protein GlcU|uniref:YgaP family membrane protein n=1 Tax=Flavobacterium sp. PL11 TaxID=3071717 RepID=UPI002DF9AFE4|nr:glucose uptake protein GlcU [Flavobacterium sp. PL11]